MLSVLKPCFNLAITCLLFMSLADQLSAQIASALIREGDELPDDEPGRVVIGFPDSGNRVAANTIGGYAFSVITSDGVSSQVSHFWGNSTGGLGAIIRSEGEFGGVSQGQFRYGFGLNDSGSLAYGALADGRSIWVDSTPIAFREDPIPSIPGAVFDSLASPRITNDGIPYWYSSYKFDGSNELLTGMFLGFDAIPILKTGDNVGGVPEVIESVSSSSANFRYSPSGNDYITRVNLLTGNEDDDGLMVMNGQAMFAGGAIIREGSPIPTSIGGLAGESYRSFGGPKITDSGHYLFRGSSDLAGDPKSFLMLDGEILIRQGDTIDNEVLDLIGSGNRTALNESGDWAVLGRVELKGELIRDVLILNGRILLTEGDAIDWNNDGLIDSLDLNASLTDFREFRMSNRDADDNVRIFFIADVEVDGVERFAGFSITANANVLLGDVNQDGVVNLLDVQPFVDLLTSGDFQTEADINQDGIVSLLDVDPFVALLAGG